MRNTFVDCLIKRARYDDRIFLITPDVGFSVLERFADEFPDRYLNVGIAEQNAVGVAAGLALSGKRPYVYSMVPFVTMRCFEQVRVDVAYMKTNVVLAGIGGGLTYGPAGATHHAIEDIAIMRALPNMTICAPGDPIEARALMEQSFDHDGPIYIRLGRNGEPAIHGPDVKIEIGSSVKIADGDDLALITTGNTLELASRVIQAMQDRGRKATLISMPTIKPFDCDVIISLLDRGMPIVTLEEHTVIGGLGSAVAEIIAEYGKGVKFRRIGLPDEYSHTVGSQEYLRNHFGLNLERILEIIGGI
ncbi:MAG: transketolase C-terminal domain-containing protein [Oryzomonas sp.]|uniref:transketolase family protein n=1 Tax=Oryzomonas sp. TaxID=2855186 RepID=UPI0028450A59|nr:transketolase C-terminal domain-containing protein [Oryzomonas sp.]MDR3578465.1 transketolase C-terminal domain-containing protein [Oryzomonas sp.]